MTVIRTALVTTAAPQVGHILQEWRKLRDAIIAASSCIGLWKFDDPDYLVMNGSKIQQINNCRPGLPALVQATAARQATLVFDDDLGRNVAEFSFADINYYQIANPAVLVPDLSTTYVALFKPTLDNTILQQVAGVFTTGNDVAHVRFSKSGTTINVSAVHGDSTITTSVANGFNKWIPVIGGAEAASVGGANHVSKLQVLPDGPVLTGAAATAHPSSNTMQLSHQALRFGGRLDCLMAFQTALFSSAQAQLLADVKAFMKNRAP